MNATHTPAPWKVERKGAFDYTITNGLPQGHVQHCVVVSEVRCEENANLIAAAPELLDLVEEIFQGSCGEDRSPIPSWVADRMKRTIRKARGEQ